MLTRRALIIYGPQPFEEQSVTQQGRTCARDTPDRAQLLLLKGKQGRSESTPAAIEVACDALLTAAHVPHAVVQTPQVGVFHSMTVLPVCLHLCSAKPFLSV